MIMSQRHSISLYITTAYKIHQSNSQKHFQNITRTAKILQTDKYARNTYC